MNTSIIRACRHELVNPGFGRALRLDVPRRYPRPPDVLCRDENKRAGFVECLRRRARQECLTNLYSCVSVENFITARHVLCRALFERICRPPSLKYTGEQRGKVAIFQGLLVPLTFKQGTQRMHHSSSACQEMGVRLWLKCIALLPVYLKKVQYVFKTKQAVHTLAAQAGVCPFGVVNGFPEELCRCYLGEREMRARR